MPERHRSCDEYLAHVREAARVLVASGYLLEEDVDTSLTFAGKLWDMWA
jgi:hypothetical protein